MNILVTDASIFIDLIDCDVLSPFFELPCQYYTTDYIWDELIPEQQVLLQPAIDHGKLEIHDTDEHFLEYISEKNLSKSLSIADRSVWYLTKMKGDILLTSDGALRKMAKKHEIKTHGLLWIFEQMVNHNIISPQTAITKLDLLFENNSYYRMNVKLMNAWEELQNKWE